jgi:hypothetical protein
MKRQRIAENSLLAGIRDAQKQIARGEGFSVQEILKELPTWISQGPLAGTLAPTKRPK